MDQHYVEYYGEGKKKVCEECEDEIEPGQEVVFPGADRDYYYCPSCAE